MATYAGLALIEGAITVNAAGSGNITADDLAEYDGIFHDLTGVRTAIGNYILPLKQRAWIIRNSTAYAMTVKGATGTGIAVQPGKVAIVLSDGTNFFSAFTDTAGLGAQPLDATLTALAGLTIASQKLLKGTGPDAFSLIDLSTFIETLLDDANAATARGTLGAAPNNAYYWLRRANSELTNGFDMGSLTTGLVKITVSGSDAIPSTAVAGTDYQAASALLTAIAALSMVADRIIYGTGSGTVGLATLTSFARTILDDADAATVLATIGAQPSDAELTALAGLTSAANKGIQFTGSGTAGLFDLTTFGKSLIDDANAAAARATTETQEKVGLGFPEVPTASQKSALYCATRAITFPANLAGSYGTSLATATASTVINVKKMTVAGSTSTVDTITFGVGGRTGTFATSGGTSFSLAAGDILYLEAPASPDATLADVGATLLGD